MTKEDQIEITVKPRNLGKHFSRSLRRNFLIPAIAYGPKSGNLTFTLKENDAIKYSQSKYENTIFVLKSEDKKINGIKVLKKSMDSHPVTRRPIHLDFYALDMTQTVKVNVEIKYEGKSEGEREGGVFNAIRRDVEIECLPTEIPESFTVDIENLVLNQTLHVSDIQIPENLKLMTSVEDAICSVAEVKEVEAEVAAPVEAAEGAEATAEAAPAGDEKKSEDKDKNKAEEKK